MQIKIKKLLVVLIALVLLGIGCVTETPQNREVSKNNQNASNQNSSANTTPPPVCTNVNEAQLKAEINRLPAQLKNQFKEVNPQTGTISLSYANNELVFTGYITGNVSNLRSLISGFNNFRGKNCANVVLFKGEKEAANFEWRSDVSSKPPSNTCKKDVENIINKSSVASQIDKNLFYTFDETTNNGAGNVLTFKGYIGDNPGNGQFNALIGQLQPPITTGCMYKIVLTDETSPTGKAALNEGFEWQLCEAPLMECGGVCVNPPCA